MNYLDVINLSLKEDTVAGIVEVDEFFIRTKGIIQRTQVL